jgi:UDP-N-acetyl-D-mannosaminuronic acid transferase (WecB/TagA/CpsF family)
MLILNDGVGVDIASWWMHGSPFPENLNGPDFALELFGAFYLWACGFFSMERDARS